jgi:hypothetical protein
MQLYLFAINLELVQVSENVCYCFATLVMTDVHGLQNRFSYEAV